jgi:hypothetical protein
MPTFFNFQIEDYNLYFLIWDLSFMIKISLLLLIPIYITRYKIALSNFFASIFGLALLRIIIYLMGFSLVTNKYIALTGNIEYCQNLIARFNPLYVLLLGIIIINFILKARRYGIY